MSKNVKWFTVLIPTFYFLIPLILNFNYDSSFLRIKLIELYINCIPITLCVIFLIKKAIVNNFYKLVVLNAFIVYLCSLHQIVTFIPVWYWRSPGISSTTPLINLVPFKTILESEITQLIAPLLLLIPIAFALMSLSILKSKKKTIMVTMLISIGIELIQFIENSTGTGSAFEIYSRLTNIDDVILNTLGGVIGVYIYHFIRKGQSERLQISN
ncbi:VanZ family protein [Peribacillus muralis]|uniref:VanZ family protein n=1 Tax=Peribacillus muralis TaxID=264697 RepID=UPI0036709C81